MAFLPNDEPLREGTLVRLPGLAALLAEFGARGAALFDGPAGDAVFAAIRARGGVVERDELAGAKAEWLPAARTGREGQRIWATPLPSHGPSLLDAVASCAPGAGQTTLIEGVEAAVRRRSRAHADPAVGTGTSVVTAADASGNAVVLVHSNSFQRYGSGIVVDEYQLVLSNRAGRGFTAQPGHPNFPAPGQRPVTTLHAWAMQTPDGALLLGATPGGENQMRWNAQTLAAIRAGETDPGRLVCAPRWARFGGRLTAEANFSAASLAELRRVDEVDLVPELSLRSAQQVLRVYPARQAEVVAGADPRTGAAAFPR